MSEQLVYTLNRNGAGLSAGYGTYSTSPGLDRGDQTEIETGYSIYVGPSSIDIRDGNDPNIANMPISLSYITLKSGNECVTQQIYTGADYDNPSRLGNFISNSVVGSIGDVYPIEFYKSPQFCTDMHYAEMNVDVEPPPLATLDLKPSGLITLESVADFIKAHDMEFFKQLVYSTISAAADVRDRIYIGSKYDNVWWTAAVTMLFPKRLAKILTFTTYDGRPESCRYKIVGLFDLDRIGQSISRSLMNPDNYDAGVRHDRFFDEYIERAYTSESERDEFFTFLDRIKLEILDEGIIDAYNLYCIAVKGDRADDISAPKAFNALQKCFSTLSNSELESAFKELSSYLTEQVMMFYKGSVLCRINDPDLSKRISNLIVGYEASKARALSTPTEIINSYGLYKDSVSKCLAENMPNCLDSKAGRYYALKNWCEERVAEPVVRTVLGEKTDFVDVVYADTDLAMAVLRGDMPVSPVTKAAVSDTFQKNAAALSVQTIRELFIISVPRDVVYGRQLLEGCRSRMDYSEIISTYLEISVKIDDREQIIAGIKAMADYCSEQSKSFGETLNFLQTHRGKVDDACTDYVLRKFTDSLSFERPQDVAACREAIRSFPDNDSSFTRDGVNYVKLMICADEVSRDKFGVKVPSVSKLSDQERDNFFRMCFDSNNGRLELGWMKNRLKPFENEPDLAVEAMCRYLKRRMGDRFNVDLIADYIVASNFIKASDDAIYRGIRGIDKKDVARIRKIISKNYADFLPQFDGYFGSAEDKAARGFGGREDTSGEKKGGFFGKREESPRPEEKKGGLFGGRRNNPSSPEERDDRFDSRNGTDSRRKAEDTHSKPSTGGGEKQEQKWGFFGGRGEDHVSGKKAYDAGGRPQNRPVETSRPTSEEHTTEEKKSEEKKGFGKLFKK